MKTDILDDPEFRKLLVKIDRDAASVARASGCRCGGALHQGHYPRKMRGSFEATPEYSKRYSFCCARCRRRVTPPSVRFLGRRQYPAGLVALACDVDKKGMRREHCAALQQFFGVTRRTVMRWRRWWRLTMPQTQFWTIMARPRFMPLAEPSQLPRSLLTRFLGEDASTKLVYFLRFIGPLTIGNYQLM